MPATSTKSHENIADYKCDSNGSKNQVNRCKLKQKHQCTHNITGRLSPPQLWPQAASWAQGRPPSHRPPKKSLPANSLRLELVCNVCTLFMKLQQTRSRAEPMQCMYFTHAERTWQRSAKKCNVAEATSDYKSPMDQSSDKPRSLVHAWKTKRPKSLMQNKATHQWCQTEQQVADATRKDSNNLCNYKQEADCAKQND